MIDVAIKCCRYCVPPQRYPGCHAVCEQYIKEKAEYDEQKARAKAQQAPLLTQYDFDEINYASSKRHKRRSRE